MAKKYYFIYILSQEIRNGEMTNRMAFSLQADSQVPIPGGGYLLSIFSGKVPDSHICPECFQVLRVPMMCTCGHRYCKWCLENVIALVYFTHYFSEPTL